MLNNILSVNNIVRENEMKETNKMKYLLRVALAFALLPALGLNGMAFPQNEVSVPESATTSD